MTCIGMKGRNDMTRQRAWQLVQRGKGLCEKCSRKAARGSVFCRRHRDYSRRYTRIKQGTPLDRPVQAYRKGSMTPPQAKEGLREGAG